MTDIDKTRRHWLRAALFGLPAIALGGAIMAGPAAAQWRRRRDDDDDDDDDDDNRGRRRRRGWRGYDEPPGQRYRYWDRERLRREHEWRMRRRWRDHYDD